MGRNSKITYIPAGGGLIRRSFLGLDVEECKYNFALSTAEFVVRRDMEANGFNAGLEN